MDELLRKLRGIIGAGVTWAVGWALVMMLIGIGISIVDPDSIDQGEEIWRVLGIVGTVGFFSGTIFGGLMALAEGRRTSLMELSPLRAALLGALAGAALPLLTGINDSVLSNTVPLGALFASATVALARRAERAELRAQEREIERLES